MYCTKIFIICTINRLVKQKERGTGNNNRIPVSSMLDILQAFYWCFLISDACVVAGNDMLADAEEPTRCAV
jgi:hypothetical protein